MREILFKGKNVDNGEWVEGCFVKVVRYLDDRKMSIIIPTDTYLCENCEIDEYIKVDPETVCQYTGLTDNNGKKIFEGDILRLEQSGNVKVMFEDGVFGAYFNGYGVLPLWKSLCGDGGQVIGNIFDNPDLLPTSSTDSDQEGAGENERY